jgi:hypothetical protein
MLKHALSFYKSLFGEEEESGVELGSDFWEDEEKVNAEENEFLETPFFEEEVKEAVFRSYAEGAPGPNGFSFLFY